MRGGSLVSVCELHPTRRYPLTEFAWLASDPTPPRVFSPSSPDGHAPLPARTQQYLTSGASNGNRNAELFAAACQLRDAGYSQADAERDLVPRHVADASSGENAATREREARATIASAYGQPAREPLPSPQQAVSQLVARYGSERPSPAQRVAAVHARHRPAEGDTYQVGALHLARGSIACGLRLYRGILQSSAHLLVD